MVRGCHLTHILISFLKPQIRIIIWMICQMPILTTSTRTQTYTQSKKKIVWNFGKTTFYKSKSFQKRKVIKKILLWLFEWACKKESYKDLESSWLKVLHSFSSQLHYFIKVNIELNVHGQSWRLWGGRKGKVGWMGLNG